MATRPRNWAKLKPSTRDRYLAKGRKQGLTPAQTEQLYMSGAPLGEFRGHRPRPGASERQWARMVQAAKAARLNEDVEGDFRIVLESLLAKGYKPAWIIRKLEEKKESRDTYRSPAAGVLRKQGKAAGWEPGRSRFFKRDQPADIELYYYH